MEVSQDQLISLALNFVGYIAAGALWMVIFSFYRDRKKAGAAVRGPAAEPVVTKAVPETVKPAREKTNVEFVSLTRSTGQAAAATVDPAPVVGGQNRRNRAEVIKMAQEMLKANVNSEKIKHTLPITEGELAMIKNK
jgi:hypothetical protein